jgi:hypothetical protein
LFCDAFRQAQKIAPQHATRAISARTFVWSRRARFGPSGPEFKVPSLIVLMTRSRLLARESWRHDGVPGDPGSDRVLRNGCNFSNRIEFTSQRGMIECRDSRG